MPSNQLPVQQVIWLQQTQEHKDKLKINRCSSLQPDHITFTGSKNTSTNTAIETQPELAPTQAQVQEHKHCGKNTTKEHKQSNTGKGAETLTKP